MVLEKTKARDLINMKKVLPTFEKHLKKVKAYEQELLFQNLGKKYDMIINNIIQ